MSKVKYAYFLPLVFVLFAMMPDGAHAQKRDRYKSKDSSVSRYDSKDRSERRSFDKNFNRYQNLSPSQKRDKLDKWRDFKSNTTPEERRFIREKMRKDQR